MKKENKEKNRKLDLPKGVPPLTTYYMYITGGCNLACRHCWIDPTFHRDGGSGECLDYDLFKIAVDESLSLGLNRIKFTGGEPLLHSDFNRMADYATEKSIQCDLETNGTLITKQLAFNLKQKTSVRTIAISLDGSCSSTHDYLRNVQGCFDDSIKGIKYLTEAGYRPQVIMSLYPDNAEEIESLIDLSIKLGCGSVKFNIIQSSGRGEKLKKSGGLLSIEKLVQLGNWIEHDLQKKYAIHLFFSWPMVFHSIKRLGKGSGENCNIFYVLGILSLGDLAMCGIGTQEKDLVYGTLGRDRVRDVWCSSPGLMKLREVVPGHLEGICGQCLFKNRCLGTCVAQNYHATGSLTAPFWFCHQADEAGLFPNKRKK
jgi:SynChlorMet cassette radical SAM/SPASM protein ScmF